MYKFSRTTFLTAGGFDKQVLSGNHLGGCHGGLLSTIVDVGGSLAIATENMHSTGVSTDLNVSFISGAKIGDMLSIDSRCDKIGGTLAYTSVEIKVDDKIVALGRHTKFVHLAHKANAELKRAALE
ncbi:hypothetical protein FBU30_001766 [Linnemannia zychae]|nr:hypothetical protein FBU30_001766 [Linnemannia zychae]